MSIISSKIKIPLADGWELWVVNSGPNTEVVLSFTEGVGKAVRERITVHLSQAQAMRLARSLAGVLHHPFSPFDMDDKTNPD